MQAFILLILIGVYALRLVVELLNFKYRNRPLAEQVKDIYDDERYQKWLNYSLDTHRFSVFKSGFNLVVLMLLLVLGGFGWLESVSAPLSGSVLIQNLIFLGIYMVFTMVISIPFDYYDTFIIEEKYGFNKTTKKTFVLDIIRNVVLLVVLGGGIVSFLYLPFHLFAGSFVSMVIFTWLGAILVVFVIIGGLNKLLVRLFNKLTPLEEGSLRTRIERMAQSVGFNLKNIFIMDASKRSTKLNAFFSGMGKLKEVVLFDTLVDKMNEDEIVSVLAHELGHAVFKDTFRMFIQQALVFALYALLIGFIFQSDALATAFGLSGVHFGFGLVLFSILISPINLLLGIPLSYLSRKAEYKADDFAQKLTNPEHMISALKVLAREVLVNLNPHPLYVLLYYSHPPMKERIQALELKK